MGVIFRAIRHLLPRSRLWSLAVDGVKRKFFEALGEALDVIREHLGSLFLEAFPQYTTHAQDWSTQFGAMSLLSEEELLAEWASTGGQSPRYIQDQLQAAGYDVYVHEWWEPGSNPPVARDPIALVPTSRVLVNDINTVEKRYTYQFGDGTQLQGDEEIYFGKYDGYYLKPKIYPTPDVPNEYPTYFYICGETWPQYATVAQSSLRKLIRLIYKMKPMQLRCILRVRTYDDGDIFDSIIADDDYQDALTASDDIQDSV